MEQVARLDEQMRRLDQALTQLADSLPPQSGQRAGARALPLDAASKDAARRVGGGPFMKIEPQARQAGAGPFKIEPQARQAGAGPFKIEPEARQAGGGPFMKIEPQARQAGGGPFMKIEPQVRQAGAGPFKIEPEARQAGGGPQGGGSAPSPGWALRDPDIPNPQERAADGVDFFLKIPAARQAGGGPQDGGTAPQEGVSLKFMKIDKLLDAGVPVEGARDAFFKIEARQAGGPVIESENAEQLRQAASPSGKVIIKDIKKRV